ncbi:flagellar protein FlaG [Oceaniserpentilla sp. 4NH20-0058]|uniref:flagellar protein FlaG n=1 Tax=Oceaniserpentilla sp. 4NH20-0058 TaxID=3127660 RepID=UPI0031065636
MNEIKAQNTTVNTAGSLTSAPQVQSQKPKADVSAKAETEVVTSGKQLPNEDATAAAEAKSVEVKEAVSKLNEYVQKTQRDLDFRLDEDSGKTVISVYDRHSEQLVRQIPNEAALEMAKKLNSEEPTLLFSAQV